MNKKTLIPLIKKILTGTSSKAEEEEIDASLRDSFISNDWNEQLMGSELDVKKRIVKNIKSALKEENKYSPNKVLSLKNIIRAAAVITTLVGFSIYYYPYLQNRDNNKYLVEKMLLPGTEKASLKLGNGTVLNLENLGEGAVYKDEAVLISKSASGDLTYNYSDTKSKSKIKERWNTLNTPKGGKINIVLPDGTRALLNAGSSLVFPEKFDGNERLVKAYGEVYFNVTKDKSKPFVVNSRDMDIRVLGTTFILSNYNDDEPSVSLLEGKVVVNAIGRTLHLVPGQKVKIRNQNLAVETFDPESEAAWTNDYFIFKKRSLKEIMNSISRWYDADVKYQSNDLLDKKFTLRISRRQDIREILSLIELTGSVKFKIIGRRVVVKQ